MQLWSRLKSLARNLLHKAAAESEIDEELQSYTETITEEKIAAGLSPAEARRTTLADIGGLEQVKQSVRDRRTGTGLELLWQDVRYALRQLRRNRAFTLTAIIALGIGARTAIFSAVYALLLRPLPYSNGPRKRSSPLNSQELKPLSHSGRRVGRCPSGEDSKLS